MIFLLDNYDSFTFNLYQYLAELGEEVLVRRNDEITISEIRKLNPQGIVISPGPCDPSKAGISVKLVKELYKEYPILGVCLGHQCIGEAFGARIVKAPRIMHGKTSMIRHDGKGIFKGIPLPFKATRYHSLIIDPSSLPAEIEVSAFAERDDEIMGIRHKVYPIEGVQFHPESILTLEGKKLLKNFIEICKK